jgi:hypothetical protein
MNNSSPENEIRLYSTNRLEDIKNEKIAFVIDMYEEITNEDFLSLNGDTKLKRADVITEEILNFVKLKDFCSEKTEFALYIYNTNLKKEIKFCEISEFMMKYNDYKNNRYGKDGIAQGESYLDLVEIFKEAEIYTKPMQSIESYAKQKGKDNDFIIRFILLYNRSEIPVVMSNNEYNIMTFMRNPYFIFDVIFLRRKISNDDDKKKLLNTFNSLNNIRPQFFYIFEISGSLQKFKFYMNLLLANPNQRIKLSNIDKFHKKMENLINNFEQ